jgi:hypothetical protein
MSLRVAEPSAALASTAAPIVVVALIFAATPLAFPALGVIELAALAGSAAAIVILFLVTTTATIAAIVVTRAEASVIVALACETAAVGAAISRAPVITAVVLIGPARGVRIAVTEVSALVLIAHESALVVARTILAASELASAVVVVV